MTANHPNANEAPEELPEAARYAAFTNEDGSVVIYDETNNSAWIQSDGAIDIEAMV